MPDAFAPLAGSPVTWRRPVEDLERARRLCEQGLGLQALGARPDGKSVDRCAGTELALFPWPEGSKADHTALGFRVDAVAAALRALEARGARLADHDLPDLGTGGHVCVPGSEKAAWSQDTEGNLLCLHEDPA